MVTFQNRTDFFARYEDGKREMTLSEIREIFNNDLIALRLSKVEDQISSLIDLQQVSELRKKAEKMDSSISPRFLSLSNGEILSDMTLRRFVEEIGQTPYFRVSITPLSPRSDYLNVDSKIIRDLLDNPPGSRKSGWNMESDSRVERYEEGVYRGNKNYEYLELMSNGHMEFWTPLGKHFCWRQSAEEFRIKPRLYFLPVIEYPATFFRLYRAIVGSFQVSDNFIVDFDYRNLKGYTLSPSPGSLGFGYSGEVKTFQNQHLSLPRIKIPPHFEADKITYDRIVIVYSAFGIESKIIPLYSNEGKFNFP